MIQELRTLRAGRLAGARRWSCSTRVLMLVTDVVLCEDGHAQELLAAGERPPKLDDAKDVWVDDCNFYTTSFLFEIARGSAFFVTRQHASTLQAGSSPASDGTAAGPRP